MTPLFLASFKGWENCVRVLLEYRADIKATDLGGSTALHAAAFSGNVGSVRALLQAGANPAHVNSRTSREIFIHSCLHLFSSQRDILQWTRRLPKDTTRVSTFSWKILTPNCPLRSSSPV